MIKWGAFDRSVINRTAILVMEFPNIITFSSLWILGKQSWTLAPKTETTERPTPWTAEPYTSDPLKWKLADLSWSFSWDEDDMNQPAFQEWEHKRPMKKPLLGFGVPHFNTFWHLLLQGNQLWKESLYFFLPGYFKAQFSLLYTLRTFPLICDLQPLVRDPKST